MQAIRTKYHGPTNTRGSRISAKCGAGSISVSYDYALNIDGNHRAACDALVKKLGWDTGEYADMVGGEFDGAHYWVFDDKRLKALKAIVSGMRAATWTGSPWGKPEFKEAVKTCGRAHGFYGDALEVPDEYTKA